MARNPIQFQPGLSLPAFLEVMHARNRGETLTGRIEIDDAYLGGLRPCLMARLGPGG